MDDWAAIAVSILETLLIAALYAARRIAQEREAQLSEGVSDSAADEHGDNKNE